MRFSKTPGATEIGVVVAGLTLVVLVVLHLTRGSRREGFSFGNLFKKVTSGVSTGVNTVKNTAVGGFNTAKGVVNNVVNKPYAPTYVGRAWNGFEWECPTDTVDTGRSNDVACLASSHMHPLWRWNGSSWGWSCPNGTAPTAEGEWNKRCEKGWIFRAAANGTYACPGGTWDSGATWSNSTWHGAHKQCKLSTMYTTRMWDGRKWSCPAGTTDTNRTWGMASPEKQCRLNAG